MGYIVSTLNVNKINLKPATTAEEVMQNVAMIISTPRGTVPLDRGFGLSQDYIDKPINVAKALLLADIMDTVPKYEPRVQVDDVTFEIDESVPGKLIPKVEVTILDA
jgi:phage baseplate assembly protein W